LSVSDFVYKALKSAEVSVVYSGQILHYVV